MKAKHQSKIFNFSPLGRACLSGRQGREGACLSIAGFDPSAGAGILADIKTFEANEVYGFGICSALTFQNEAEFDAVKWISQKDILQQMEVLLRRHKIDHAKIGIIENLAVLEKVIDFLKKYNPGVKIIWDPILKATAGFSFHNKFEKGQLEKILSKIYLLTPNRKEIKILVPGLSEEDAAKYLSSFCSVLLKGGHTEKVEATDILFSGDEAFYFTTEKINSQKHGTGCVLSAAITANLAKEKSLPEACKTAKAYINKFIQSTDSLLGLHYRPVDCRLTTDNFPKKISPLQFITADISAVEAACKAGLDWIQLRIKNISEEDYIIAAKKAKAICQRYNAILIINDNVNVAKEANADGVHLGKNDMPVAKARAALGEEFIIGGTANTIEDIKKSSAAKADYIGLGPYRFTATKENLSPVLGLEGIKKILAEAQSIASLPPIIVIGGIQLPDVKNILALAPLPLGEGPGVGLAVSSAIEKNIPEESKKFLAELKSTINYATT